MGGRRVLFSYVFFLLVVLKGVFYGEKRDGRKACAILFFWLFLLAWLVMIGLSMVPKVFMIPPDTSFFCFIFCISKARIASC